MASAGNFNRVQSPNVVNTEENNTRKENGLFFDNVIEPKALRTLIDDDIFLMAGHFAILCQWAHPGLAKGTAKHSNFGSRIPQRPRNTSRFLNAAVYGNPEEKKAITSVIHQYHARVKGDGYDADDPELHRWTAATLFVAILIVQETFFRKLDRGEMLQVYKECSVFGASLRMPPDMWPDTLEDFWKYWNHNIETLEVTPMARELSHQLLYPVNLPLWMRLQIPFARLLTTHWLPARLTREYGIEVSQWSRSMYHLTVAGICFFYPQLPEGIRKQRHRVAMEDMKRAAKKIQSSGHWNVGEKH